MDCNQPLSLSCNANNASSVNALPLPLKIVRFGTNVSERFLPLFPTRCRCVECARKVGLAAASFSVLILFSTSIYARIVATYTRRFGVRVCACACVLRDEATI